VVNLGRLILACCLMAVGTAHGESRLLSDDQLDLVTAGSTEVVAQGSGTAIVGTDGKLAIGQINSVVIREQAQRGAQVLNLVNSQQASTANAMNLWAQGRSGDGINASPAADMAVYQSNEVRQTRRMAAGEAASASLQEAILLGPIVTDVTTTSRTSGGTAAIDGRINLFGRRTTEMTSDDSTDTTNQSFSVQVQAGTGMALAGTGEFEVSAGSFTIDWLNSATTTSTEAITVLGIQVKNEKTTVTVTERLEATIDLGNIRGSVKGDFLCVVQAGNCTGGGTTVTSTTRFRREIMPTSLSGAEGQYIVMSGGELTTDTVDTVSLSGMAQQGVAAVNLVNAVTSTAANGVNVARTNSMSGGAVSLAALALNQHNRFTQTR